MRIGFIGCGNMASAIIKGIVCSDKTACEEIIIYDIDQAKAESCAAEFGAHRADSAEALIRLADSVILAVKPNVFPTLLPSIASALQEKNPLIISIAAGKTLEYLQGLLCYEARLVRVMPNINAMVQASMSAYCYNSSVTEEDKALTRLLFSAAGNIIELDEKFFPIFGVIAGCAPAYGYLFIDALARAGVKNGLNKKMATEIAAQTLLGSAKMILESGVHPQELIDRVCSPGGTTIEGLFSLQADGFEAAVHKAVDDAVAKDQKV